MQEIFYDLIPFRLWAEEHYQTDYRHVNRYEITY